MTATADNPGGVATLVARNSPPRLAGRAGQMRSRVKRQAIIEAAVDVIASHGSAGLTHRLVAKRASVSTAATTYYFENKADIVRAAWQMTLDGFDRAFDRKAASLDGKARTADSFSDYLASLIGTTAGPGREDATCWGEFMLNAPRNSDDLDVARDWFARQILTWRSIAAACGARDPEQQAVCATDVLIGMVWLITGLGLREEEIGALRSGRSDLLELRPPNTGIDKTAVPTRTGLKALATRTRILDATIAIVKDEGSGAVNGRAVAERAGLTRAAATYYFPSVADLLAAAEHRLFAEAKERYRQGLTGSDGNDGDIAHLVDRTTAVFLREATEFACDSAAHYATWLRADGQPALRAMLWEAAGDQQRSWGHVLGRWNDGLRPIDALLGQALFIGKLVRIIATGSRMQDLAKIRREFAYGMDDFVAGSSLIR